MPDSNFETSASMQKGRVGEDMVSLGFRMLGYQVLRTGIENTALKAGYAQTSTTDGAGNPIKTWEYKGLHNYNDPLFFHIGLVPDFLLMKGNKAHWVEVKWRRNLNVDGIIEMLVKRYLYFPYNGFGLREKEVIPRKRQDHFELYENIKVIIISPEGSLMVRLGDVLYVDEKTNEVTVGYKNGKPINKDLKCSGPTGQYIQIIERATQTNSDMNDKFALDYGSFRGWYQESFKKELLVQWVDQIEAEEKAREEEEDKARQ